MRLSPLGLGGFQLGGLDGARPLDASDARALVEAALDVGIDWVDTAAFYGRGRSEELIGSALLGLPAARRPAVLSKCGLTAWSSEHGPTGDLRPASIRRELEGSLRRLGVEQVDGYQFHWPDHTTGTPVEESWAALGTLADEGKVRWMGLSNYGVAELERCEAVRHVDLVQLKLHLLDRGALADVLPWCRAHGTAVVVYRPLAAGLLAGRLGQAGLAALPPDDWRRGYDEYAEPFLRQALPVVAELTALAAAGNVSLPALALAWVLGVPGVTGAIVGASSAAQVRGWGGVRPTPAPALQARLEALVEGLELPVGP